jgi:hypothetical protein
VSTGTQTVGEAAEARVQTTAPASADRAQNRTILPDRVKAGVRVHSSSEPAQRNAMAYAQGTGIHLALGSSLVVQAVFVDDEKARRMTEAAKRRH